jgi:hypothetical protein
VAQFNGSMSPRESGPHGVIERNDSRELTRRSLVDISSRPGFGLGPQTTTEACPRLLFGHVGVFCVRRQGLDRDDFEGPCMGGP